MPQLLDWYIAPVCQIGVMSDFIIVTLTQDLGFDFKTIAVFLLSKFVQEPFILEIQI